MSSANAGLVKQSRAASSRRTMRIGVAPEGLFERYHRIYAFRSPKVSQSRERGPPFGFCPQEPNLIQRNAAVSSSGNVSPSMTENDDDARYDPGCDRGDDDVRNARYRARLGRQIHAKKLSAITFPSGSALLRGHRARLPSHTIAWLA